MTPGVERHAARAVASRLVRVADRLRAIPGVLVREAGDRVVIEGRGLRRRAAEEPALRWPGGAA